MSAPRLKQYDTVVVGAGPAGMMAAYEASLRSDVLLIDSARLPRVKACGGMLNEAAQVALSRFAKLPAEVLVSPRSVSFRFRDLDRDIVRPVDMRFVNIDRARFDAWLMRTIVPRDVEVVSGCALSGLAEDADGVIVSMSTDEGPVAIRCATLIGADGARSGVRRAIGRALPSTYVTIQDHLRLRGEADPAFECVYMRGVGEGFAYAYVVPKDEVAVVGSIFHPGTKDANLKQDRVIAALRERMPHLGESTRREAAPALYLRSPSDVVHGEGRVLLAGEAGGFMSPTSGEGISYALETGSAAGRAAACSPEGPLEAYRRETARMTRGIRKRFRWLPVIESPTGKYVAGWAPSALVSRVAVAL